MTVQELRSSVASEPKEYKGHKGCGGYHSFTEEERKEFKKANPKSPDIEYVGFPYLEQNEQIKTWYKPFTDVGYKLEAYLESPVEDTLLDSSCKLLIQGKEYKTERSVIHSYDSSVCLDKEDGTVCKLETFHIVDATVVLEQRIDLPSLPFIGFLVATDGQKKEIIFNEVMKGSKNPSFIYGLTGRVVEFK